MGTAVGVEAHLGAIMEAMVAVETLVEQVCGGG